MHETTAADKNPLPLPAIGGDEATLARLVKLGKAFSDPTRLRMLGLMAEGRGCCGLPAPPGAENDEGICVCEFEARFGLGQSKVSYHLRVLREAGLVTERARGKWTYYALNKEAARELLAWACAALQL